MRSPIVEMQGDLGPFGSTEAWADIVDLFLYAREIPLCVAQDFTCFG